MAAPDLGRDIDNAIDMTPAGPGTDGCKKFVLPNPDSDQLSRIEIHVNEVVTGITIT